MKILATGDWHLDDKTPENRTDDYPETQYSKIKQILRVAKEEDVEAILQPGDFFNNFRVSDDLKRKYIKLLRAHNITILTVPGQHDLRYHNSDINDTPIGVLNAAGVVVVIEDSIHQYGWDDGAIDVYGAGWEKSIPKIINENAYNILLIHKMVIKDEKIWHDQKEFSMANNLLRKTNFDLIVSGDNHASFIHTNKRKKSTLINCGSLMRARIDQSKHKPIVYIIDTITGEIEERILKVKKFQNIMEVEKNEKIKERSEQLESFVEKLSKTNELKGLDFKKNLIQYIKDNNIEDDVAETINEIMG